MDEDYVVDNEEDCDVEDYCGLKKRQRRSSVYRSSAQKKKKSARTSAGTAILMVEADYQQDKALIHFGDSPQPGPTYFMSHPTAYVLVLHCPSRGGTEGESKYAANHVMIREQAVGGSKDSNDTVTGMHLYLHGAPSAGFKPPAFRTGFGKEGYAGASKLLPAESSTSSTNAI